MQWAINPYPKVAGRASGLDEAVACSHFSSEGWEGLGSRAITGGYPAPWCTSHEGGGGTCMIPANFPAVRDMMAEDLTETCGTA